MVRSAFFRRTMTVGLAAGLALIFPHAAVAEDLSWKFFRGVDVTTRGWDRATLERTLAAVHEFQAQRHLPIFIGEFSASRFAGADGDRYLGDLIAIFEREGWSWAYHDFRVSAVWNPAMSVLDRASRELRPEVPRMELLRHYFQSPPVQR